MALSVLTSLGCQSGGVGIGLWSTTLLVLLLKIKPAEASYLMIFAGFVGLDRTLCFLLAVRRDRASAVRRTAELWRGLVFGACRILPRRFHRRRLGLLPDAVRPALFRRRRLCRRRTLCGGGLAVAAAGERHGFWLWHRQFRQDPGAPRAGADRRLVGCDQPQGDDRRDRAGDDVSWPAGTCFPASCSCCSASKPGAARSKSSTPRSTSPGRGSVRPASVQP